MAERRCAVDLSRESVQPQPVAMVCLDLDGTLFNRSKQIGQLSRRQIQRCLDQGVEVAVVSGRAYQFAYKTAQMIDSRLSVIGFVGAYRCFHGQAQGEPIPQAALYEALTLLKREDCPVFMKQLNTIYCSHDVPLSGDYVAYTADQPPQHRIVLHSNQDLPVIAQQNSDPVYKLLVRARGRTEAIAQQLRPLSGIRIFIYPYGDIEVISAQADKGIAIREAAAQLGIQQTQILGIGDSVNDLPMFAGCGLRVAMDNAVDPVKAQADYITLTNDEDGVGEALRRLVL
ncbi:HAD family hydrolase [Holdemania massiliensis]|uniref:HAD family hydrolase n=1 Tax=Holdemania massiliensis TaxID=1468449 RepID=UPI0035212C8F